MLPEINLKTTSMTVELDFKPSIMEWHFPYNNSRQFTNLLFQTLNYEYLGAVNDTVTLFMIKRDVRKLLTRWIEDGRITIPKSI